MGCQIRLSCRHEKIARDISDRKRSETQINLLAREAEHRAKNLLATVQATVNLSQAEE